MKEMELNPGQRLAVETLDNDLSISAGAGSGKTRVLVARFCRIVQEDRADIDQVLTVTFTEKAAREMKERMVKRFGELFEATGEERFREAARRIESAYIGTIHSFAAKVLRENAFEAKVDPQFGTLTEVEADMVKEQVLDDLLTAKQVGEVRSYLDIVRTFGRDRLTKTIKKFHAKMATLGRVASEIPAAPPAGPGATRQALETYIGAVDALLVELEAGRLTGKLVDQLEAFAPEYPGLKAKMMAAFERLEAAGSIAAADAFDWVDYEELAVIEKFVDNRVGSNSVKEEFIKPAKAAAGLFLAALIDPISAYYVGCLKEILADFSVAYAQAKARRGLLDFDDLLLKTRELLLDADGLPTRAAKDYRNHFEFVMVDEFQDTNELQLSLIKAVCPPDRFFTVGDAKQSIYSFMHSDIAVFQKHHGDVGRRGGSAVPLVRNYRSCPGAIDFINGFFDELWKEDTDFDFEPLEACGEFRPHSQPKTEILVVQPEGGAAASRRAEAGAIAGRIRALLGQDGQAPLMITDRQGPDGPLLTRALRPSDIVILFSATTSIKIYEQALNDAGIDFYVVSGRGFYSTPEVRDVVDLLKVVDNPLDDVAMAAVLRSPMVGLSDDGLWWLTRDISAIGDGGISAAPARRGAGKFYAGLRRLEKLGHLSERDRTRLADWRGILERLHGIRSESKVVRLIATAVRAVDYDLKLLASPNGRQKYANLRKLMADTEALGARSLFALSDFIRHMETMETMAEREGEAPTEIETSPVVRLMTIHKAKGLEAPVVFVADCSRKLRSGDGDAFIIDKDLGVAAKVKNPLTEEPLASSAYEPVAAKLKQKDVEESKRLLYVAATRAKELLIFSGASKLDGKAAKEEYSQINSWMGWLEKALDLRADQMEGEPTSPEGSIVTIGGADVALRRATARGQRDDSGELSLSYLETQGEALRAGSRLALGPDVPAAAANPSATGELASTAADGGVFSILNQSTGRLPAGETPVMLGVTQAVDFFVCPEKYRLKWVAGLDEPPKGPFVTADNARAAAALGSAVHEVLASVDFKGDVEAQVERLAILRETALQAGVRRLCRVFLDSPWPARLGRSERVFQEAPFSVALPGCRLSGRIDLLFKESAGWVVADYKTGAGADLTRYAAQVDIYALALKKSLDTLPVEAVVIGLGSKDDFARPVDSALLDGTEELLTEAARAIREADFSVRPGVACDTCGYAGGPCRSPGRF